MAKKKSLNKELKKIRPQSSSEIKEEIQAVLRKCVMKRDGGCVLRAFPEAGACGGWRNDGNLILQAEHLVSRAKIAGFGDLRNIVCLCKNHHFFFKKRNSFLYWQLIEKIIGPERWAWIKKLEADRTIYHMTQFEWGKILIALKQEYEKL